MDLEALENIGLSTQEAVIYVALLEGATTAGKLADKTHIHRRTAYDVLNSLKEKGLVTYFEKEGVTNYVAVDPELLSGILEERQSAIKELLPILKAKQEATKTKNLAYVYQGIKGIKTIFDDILNNKEYVAFGEGMKIVESLGSFFDYFQNEKKKRGIKARVLMGEQFRSQKTVTGSYSKFRFLKEYQPPVLTYIYANKVAIIIWSEIPTAFVIESKDTSDAYKSYFELLWKNAKD